MKPGRPSRSTMRRCPSASATSSLQGPGDRSVPPTANSKIVNTCVACARTDVLLLSSSWCERYPAQGPRRDRAGTQVNAMCRRQRDSGRHFRFNGRQNPYLHRGARMLSFLIASIEAGMGQVLVRNLDDRVIESLKTKAELKGRSLEQELRDVLTNAAPLTPEEKIAVFKKIRAMTPPIGDIDVRAAIRRGRDDEFDD
jgi:plasmid stability protein